jgi:hypothetical protein
MPLGHSFVRLLLSLVGIAAMVGVSVGIRAFLNSRSNEFIYGFGFGAVTALFCVWVAWKIDPLSFVNSKRKIEIATKRGDWAAVEYFKQQDVVIRRGYRKTFVFCLCVCGLAAVIVLFEKAGYLPIEQIQTIDSARTDR